MKPCTPPETCTRSALQVALSLSGAVSVATAYVIIFYLAKARTENPMPALTGLSDSGFVFAGSMAIATYPRTYIGISAFFLGLLFATGRGWLTASTVHPFRALAIVVSILNIGLCLGLLVVVLSSGCILRSAP